VKRRPSSLRLRSHDYGSTGAYFVTICAHRRECVLGDIRDGIVACTAVGDIVRDEWFNTAIVRPYLRLNADAFVAMPNHIHGIIHIVGAQRRCAPTSPVHNVPPCSLAAIVRAFKSAAATRVNALRGTPRAPLWQRNYHDRVIRDEDEPNRIRTYIKDNPLSWPDDDDNVAPVTGRGTVRHAPTNAAGVDVGDGTRRGARPCAPTTANAKTTP
jgi:putative transposase